MDKQILVTQSSMPTLDEFVDEIRDIWDTKWLTNMGIKHKTLVRELINYLKVDNIDLLTNGHMAIELSLQAFHFAPGSEVITTPYTFASTTHAIVRNNLVPVFCDINPVDFTIDVEKIEKLITPKTVAILPVHVYGNICNVEKIEKIAKKYNLKVIYDAAHTFGVEYNGKGIGSFGDVSCFSFHATKVFNTIEGGAVCFRDINFGKEIYKLKNFGIKDQETVDGVGANAKMNEFCAAMGICNLRHVDGEIAKRKMVVERYYKKLSKIDGLQLNPVQKGVKQNYAYFPVIFHENFGATRDEVQKKLIENNIFSRKYFYPITNSFDCYKGKFDDSKTPIALEYSKKVLTLPLYADLDLNVVDEICDIIISMKK